MNQVVSNFVNPFLGQNVIQSVAMNNRLDKLKPFNIQRDPVLVARGSKNSIVSADTASYITSLRSIELKRAKDTRMYIKLVHKVEFVINGDSKVGDFAEFTLFPGQYDDPSKGKGFQAQLCNMIAAAFNVPLDVVYLFNPNNPNDQNIFFQDGYGRMCFNVGVAVAHPANPLANIPTTAYARQADGQLAAVQQGVPMPVAWRVNVTFYNGKKPVEVTLPDGQKVLEYYNNVNHYFNPVTLYRDVNSNPLSYAEPAVNNVK